MSTATTWQIDTTSSEQTEQLGHDIGRRLRGGEVIELRSDLGGGKTTFVRGLVAGAGSLDVVSSPSFTISKVYKAGNLTIHHYDFYRLPDAGLMAQELAEVLEDPAAVVVVEWAGAVESVLPRQKVVITISVKGDEERHLKFEDPQEQTYLKEPE